jgi:hypothetical protein
MSKDGSEENLQSRSCVSHLENLQEEFRKSFQEFSSGERINPFNVVNVSNINIHWIFFLKETFCKEWQIEVPPFREGLHLGSTVALGQTVFLRHCCQALNKTNRNIGRESQTLI